mmetsp:Transcript_22520/g.36207  ORF Transcript_22520/g.36207 Transcript_22520/m.36207 type:complete len:166 (+) Transcript_22520:90-587(+)
MFSCRKHVVMPVDFYDKYQVKERWTLGCENVLDAFMFRWLTFGDGVPGVDAAKQANNEVTNIAILAALGLTIVLPMLVEPNDDLGDEELHWQTLLWFSSFVSLFMSLTFAIVLLIAVGSLSTPPFFLALNHQSYSCCFFYSQNYPHHYIHHHHSCCPYQRRHGHY